MKVGIIDRFQHLLDRVTILYTNSHKNYHMENYSYKYNIDDRTFASLTAWKLSVKNILRHTYGEDSEHYKLFNDIFSSFNQKTRRQYCKENLSTALGILESAKEEFELGFSENMKHILTVEFFDGIVEQAKELLDKGFKDPAAILGRVIIENTLKDISSRNGIKIADNEKLIKVLEILKDKKVFTLPQFKLCRTYIEIGNDAAHGKFEKYDKDDVKKMFDYFENTLLVF